MVGFNFVYGQSAGCGTAKDGTLDDNHINGFMGTTTGSLTNVPQNTKMNLPFTVPAAIQKCPPNPYGYPQWKAWSSATTAKKASVTPAPNGTTYAYYFWETACSTQGCVS